MTEPETAAKPNDGLSETSGGLARWTPSIPTNILSMLNPFSNEEGGEQDKDNASLQQSAKRNSLFASLLPTSSPAPPPTPPSPSKDDESIMFAEPDSRSNSDGGSREGSVVDKLAKRSYKSKTCYSICHPPTTSQTRRKLHRRPRSLLQLHKLCNNARPQPAYEVIPSANFSVRLTKAITRVFKAKHGLCPNDLVVLRAEKYSADEPDEEQETRDIICLICKGRKEDGGAGAGKAKICFPGGAEWEAYPTLSGGYEMFSTDEHGLGLTVRWVPKRNKDGSKAAPNSGTRKFNFSTISPNSRRHPVIATLSKTCLDINDTYNMPDASGTTPLSTPRQQSFSALAEALQGEESEGKESCVTDDRLREIIVMTGIWVAFKEGWTPTFKYDDKDAALQRSPSLSQHSPSKSASFPALLPMSTPPASPGMPPTQLEKRNSIKSVGSSMLRKGSLLGRANRASTSSVPEGFEHDAPASPDMKRTSRTRADSASTVLVHRAASNRIKGHHQATWRPDLVAEMQEPRSSDDVAGHSPPSPTPQRRGSVARPILPSANQSEERATNGTLDGAATVAGPASATVARSPSREKRRRRSSAKRGSSAESGTDTSMGSGAPHKPVKASNTSKKKKGGWRRLLCGAGDDS